MRSLEDFLSCLTYLQHYIDHSPSTDADGVLVIGLGGGASVLATDTCDRAGLKLTPLRDGLRTRLRDLGYAPELVWPTPSRCPWDQRRPRRFWSMP